MYGDNGLIFWFRDYMIEVRPSLSPKGQNVWVVRTSAIPGLSRPAPPNKHTHPTLTNQPTTPPTKKQHTQLLAFWWFSFMMGAACTAVSVLCVWASYRRHRHARQFVHYGPFLLRITAQSAALYAVENVFWATPYMLRSVSFTYRAVTIGARPRWCRLLDVAAIAYRGAFVMLLYVPKDAILVGACRPCACVCLCGAGRAGAGRPGGLVQLSMQSSSIKSTQNMRSTHARAPHPPHAQHPFPTMTAPANRLLHHLAAWAARALAPSDDPLDAWRAGMDGDVVQLMMLGRTKPLPFFTELPAPRLEERRVFVTTFNCGECPLEAIVDDLGEWIPRGVAVYVRWRAVGEWAG